MELFFVIESLSKEPINPIEAQPCGEQGSIRVSVSECSGYTGDVSRRTLHKSVNRAEGRVSVGAIISLLCDCASIPSISIRIFGACVRATAV